MIYLDFGSKNVSYSSGAKTATTEYEFPQDGAYYCNYAAGTNQDTAVAVNFRGKQIANIYKTGTTILHFPPILIFAKAGDKLKFTYTRGTYEYNIVG